MRRGTSLLEVMLSVALLSGLVVLIVSGYGAVYRMGEFQKERLAATEIGHRVILTYVMESPDAAKSLANRYEYGQRSYRFKLREEALVKSAIKRKGMWEYDPTPRAMISANKRIAAGLTLITVDVFADLGSSAESFRAEPLMTVARVFDPLDPTSPNFLKQVQAILGDDLPAGVRLDEVER